MSWDVVATWVRINRGGCNKICTKNGIMRFVLPYPKVL